MDPAILLKLLHAGKDREASPQARALAPQMAELATSCIRPQAWVRLGPVEVLDPEAGEVRFGADLLFRSRALARILREAREGALFVLTIGGELESLVGQRLREGRAVEALLLDAAAWAAIETGLTQLRAFLQREAAARGCRLSARMAPGFLDWEVGENRTLLRAFAPCSIPVRATPTGALLPRKSITGAFGFLPRVPD
ncbi:MAG: hypothetical protein QN172_01780 [Armatimonadota bacterium]|nr:hypothetical protein [Armatimonadota bacterium]MDR7438916.1 hypothetical protein [Armatimonadota bacterium]MDR7562456.1 hypothetical protein [Armatimonadota bacterium]MDR7567044.1 hypothetical protein [Armatimonadota bacterium]MDR7601169.1 hypothetical protein [Armatimonadota bacterium]